MPKTQAMYQVPKELLGTLTAEEFRHLKRRVVAANRAMGYWYQQTGRDFMSMTVGHVSARVPGTNTFITKGRPPNRDYMSEVTIQTLVQIDIPTREKLAGEMEVATMGEIELHACIYEKRPDVVAVCHGHSDYIIMCSLFGLKLKAFGWEGMDFIVNGYGFYDKPYMIGTSEIGTAVAKALGKHSAVLLSGHGCATVSSEKTVAKAGPEDAIMRMIRLEQLCKLNWMAFSAVGKDYEKYALTEAVMKEYLSQAPMKDRFPTPGKDLMTDQCYYNAAMTRMFPEAIEG